MSAAEPTPAAELVVADGGSIPADQLAQLGIRPGTHVRVVATPDRSVGRGLAGSLPDLPDLDWEDFVRASELARHDAERPSLHDLFEIGGQRWLGEIIGAVNDGAYAEAVETILEDEAGLEGSDTEA